MDIKRHALVVFSLYAVLQLVNFYYLVFKVIRLKRNSYHIMMFTLFTILNISYITEYALWWEYGLTCSIYYMSTLKAISDALVHSIFVIKYLVLSMKVKEIVSCKPDKWLAVKSWTVIIF